MVAMVVVANALGCTGGPTSPATSITSLQVTCPISVMPIGQPAFCFAFAYSGSQKSTVTTSASWSSSDTSVASLGPAPGEFNGNSAGQVTVSATYLGKSGATTIAFVAQDFIQVVAAASQGAFHVGNTVTMTLQGDYGIASADSGQLVFVVTDQTGTLVSTITQTKQKGGGSFLISNTLAISATTTQLCQQMSLQVGSSTLSAVLGDNIRCVAVGS
jgi:hypothetical protein